MPGLFTYWLGLLLDIIHHVSEVLRKTESQVSSVVVCQLNPRMVSFSLFNLSTYFLCNIYYILYICYEYVHIYMIFETFKN